MSALGDLMTPARGGASLVRANSFGGNGARGVAAHQKASRPRRRRRQTQRQPSCGAARASWQAAGKKAQNSAGARQVRRGRALRPRGRVASTGASSSSELGGSSSLRGRDASARAARQNRDFAPRACRRPEAEAPPAGCAGDLSAAALGRAPSRGPEQGVAVEKQEGPASSAAVAASPRSAPPSRARRDEARHAAKHLRAPAEQGQGRGACLEPLCLGPRAALTHAPAAQVSLSAFAFLFSELVQYNQSRVSNINELERRHATAPLRRRFNACHAGSSTAPYRAQAG